LNTQLEFTAPEPGIYEVKAVQGQVVTRHRVSVNAQFLERIGLQEVEESSVVPEVCTILLQHEALAAVPADSTLEQLVGQYPYLPAELQERLVPGSPRADAVGSVRIAPVAAEDRPTHT
jgi:hypothetical protein